MNSPQSNVHSPQEATGGQALGLGPTWACAALAFRRIFSGKRQIAAAVVLASPVAIALATALISRWGLDQRWRHD